MGKPGRRADDVEETELSDEQGEWKCVSLRMRDGDFIEVKARTWKSARSLFKHVRKMMRAYEKKKPDSARR